MKFQYPIFLHLIPVFLAFVLICFAMGRSLRRKRMRIFLTEELRRRADRQSLKITRVLHPVFLLAGVTLLAIALARPLKLSDEMKTVKGGVDVIVALDLSRSMYTSDVRPSRFGAARTAIKSLLKAHEGDRIAIISFAGKAYVQTPLTSDGAALKLVLDHLHPGMGVGGTNLADAINEAMRIAGIEKLKQVALILVTDGENLSGDALEAARRAAVDSKMKIFPIGIGTVTGQVITYKDRTTKNKKEMVTVKAPDGQPVVSRLDESMLRAMAIVSGGKYFHFKGDSDRLQDFYKETVRPAATPAGAEEAVAADEFYFAFAGSGLGLILLAPMLPTRKRNI